MPRTTGVIYSSSAGSEIWTPPDPLGRAEAQLESRAEAARVALETPDPPQPNLTRDAPPPHSLAKSWHLLCGKSGNLAPPHTHASTNSAPHWEGCLCPSPCPPLSPPVYHQVPWRRPEAGSSALSAAQQVLTFAIKWYFVAWLPMGRPGAQEHSSGLDHIKLRGVGLRGFHHYIHAVGTKSHPCQGQACTPATGPLQHHMQAAEWGLSRAPRGGRTDPDLGSGDSGGLLVWRILPVQLFWLPFAAHCLPLPAQASAASFTDCEEVPGIRERLRASSPHAAMQPWDPAAAYCSTAWHFGTGRRGQP